MVEEAQQQECGTGGHIASTARKPGMINAGAFILSYF